MLTQDSDPTKTAAFLKGVITEHGDQGRGDVADLLGRFHSIDPDKAKALLKRGDYQDNRTVRGTCTICTTLDLLGKSLGAMGGEIGINMYNVPA